MVSWQHLTHAFAQLYMIKCNISVLGFAKPLRSLTSINSLHFLKPPPVLASKAIPFHINTNVCFSHFTKCYNKASEATSSNVKSCC